VRANRIRHFPSLGRIPGHSMYGDWALPGLAYAYLNVVRMIRMAPGRAPQSVPLDAICAKPADWFGRDDFSGPRFERADTRVPGLLVQGMPNPCDLPYRLVDGRRRLEKLRRQGMREGPFLVFSYEEARDFIYEARLPVQ
jgi:hypothetical protein